MEIDTKTAVIAVLAILLVFALFQMSGTKTIDKNTGAALSSEQYGNSPSYTASAPPARTVNDLPAAVGGC